MPESYQHRLFDLLAKELAGELSADEKLELKKYLDKSIDGEDIRSTSTEIWQNRIEDDQNQVLISHKRSEIGFGKRSLNLIVNVTTRS